MRHLALILAVLACAQAASAEQVVKQVRIVVKSGNSDIPSEGRLYKIVGGTTKREFVANVDSNGMVDAPFSCTKPMRLWAEPTRDDVATLDDAKPCDGKLEFRFEVPRIASAAEAFTRGADLATQGDPAAAQLVYSQEARIASQRGDPLAAEAASNAAISAAAAALGDHTRSELVTRDPAQANKMVFTQDGAKALQQLQRESQLKETGQLDYATQRALSNRARKGVGAAAKGF